MEKRLISHDEIEDILSVLDEHYKILPSKMRALLLAKQKDPLRKQLQTATIYPSQIGKLKEQIFKNYRPPDAGTSIGIITSQSLGEIQTQMTLNVFHKAGFSDKAIISGVPRFSELIYTSKSTTQETPCSFIYLNENIDKTRLFRTFVYKSFENFIQQREIVQTRLNDWEIVCLKYLGLFVPEFYQRTIYTLNLELLYRFKITPFEIAQILQTKIPEALVLFSSISIGKISTSAENTEDVQVCGIKGINNAYVLPSEGKVHVETDGTNLREIMNVAFVDTFNTYSNDMWEIYELLGIEAVRELIVSELKGIMPTVHVAHINLLVDRMTVSGHLRSITRYTKKNENSSVLSKATFEETLLNFQRACFSEQKDTMVGCSASIVCGKMPKVGTGLNDLIYDE